MKSELSKKDEQHYNKIRELVKELTEKEVEKVADSYPWILSNICLTAKTRNLFNHRMSVILGEIGLSAEVVDAYNGDYSLSWLVEARDSKIWTLIRGSYLYAVGKSVCLRVNPNRVSCIKPAIVAVSLLLGKYIYLSDYEWTPKFLKASQVNDFLFTPEISRELDFERVGSVAKLMFKPYSYKRLSMKEIRSIIKNKRNY